MVHRAPKKISNFISRDAPSRARENSSECYRLEIALMNLSLCRALAMLNSHFYAFICNPIHFARDLFNDKRQLRDKFLSNAFVIFQFCR